MLEAAVAFLIFISFGGYFFYLKKIADKDVATRQAKPKQVLKAAEPIKTEPVIKNQPVELKPALFEPIEVKAVEIKPAQTKPVEVKPKPKPTQVKVNYKCVVIKTGMKACQAAQDLAGKPILLNEAPILPLQACDTSKCTCKFIKQDDRRTDDRRAHLKAAREIMGDADSHNRRERKDRRKTQH